MIEGEEEEEEGVTVDEEAVKLELGVCTLLLRFDCDELLLLLLLSVTIAGDSNFLRRISHANFR